MKTVKIKIIYQIEKRIYVMPDEGRYEKIYRGAMGVYWDDNENAFFFDNNYGITIEQALNIIKEAVFNEYGIILT